MDAIQQYELIQAPDVEEGSPTQTDKYSDIRGRTYVGYCALIEEDTGECYDYEWFWDYSEISGNELDYRLSYSHESPEYFHEAISFNLVSVGYNVQTNTYTLEIEYVFELWEVPLNCTTEKMKPCAPVDLMKVTTDDNKDYYYYFEVQINDVVIWDSYELINDVDGWIWLSNMSSGSAYITIPEPTGPMKIDVYGKDCITDEYYDPLDETYCDKYTVESFGSYYSEEEYVGTYYNLSETTNIEFQFKNEEQTVNIPVYKDATTTQYESITITNLTNGYTTNPYVINELIRVEGSENMPYLIDFSKPVEITVNLGGYEPNTKLNAKWVSDGINSYVLKIEDTIHYDYNTDTYKQGDGDPIYTYENILIFPEDIKNNYGTIQFSIPVQNYVYDEISITLNIGTQYSYTGQGENSTYYFINSETQRIDGSNADYILKIPETDFEYDVTKEKLEEWLQ